MTEPTATGMTQHELNIAMLTLLHRVCNTYHNAASVRSVAGKMIRREIADIIQDIEELVFSMMPDIRLSRVQREDDYALGEPETLTSAPTTGDMPVVHRSDLLGAPTQTQQTPAQQNTNAADKTGLDPQTSRVAKEMQAHKDKDKVKDKK